MKPTYIIQPIIIRQDRDPDHLVYEAINAHRLEWMDWWAWYTKKYNILIRDPLRLQMASPPNGWDDKITGNLWYQMRSSLSHDNWQEANSVVVFMEDHRATDTHGSGLQYWEDFLHRNIGLAIVDQAVCDSLLGVYGALGTDGYPPNLAGGVINHEIGHTVGLSHTSTPRDDIMFEWWRYPNVLIEE